MSKQRLQRGIDVTLPNTGGGESLAIAQGPGVVPALPTPPAPTSLRIVGAPVLIQSAVTPKAGVNLRWNQPTNALKPESYQVQWSGTANFGVATTRDVGNGDTAAGLDGLPASSPDGVLTLFFRVRAVMRGVPSAWSNVISAAMPFDDTPPAPVTGAAVLWSALTGGGLTVTCTPPTSPNFNRIRYRFYQSGGGGAVLFETSSAAGRFTLPIGVQRTLFLGPRTGYRIELVAISSSGVLSTSVTVDASWTRPPTATVTVDFTGPNAVFRASVPGQSPSFEWTIDGQSYTTATGEFTYTLAENRLRHGGAADPVLAWSADPRDALGLGSLVVASGTATNAAPAATTLTASIPFSTAFLTIAPSSAPDLRDYRVRVYKDGVLDETFFTTNTSAQYALRSGSGLYRFDVTVYDVFGQASTASAQTAAAQGTDITKFVADLRSGILYTDSLGTGATQLQRLSDDLNTVLAVQYPVNTWSWTRAERPFADRYDTVTLEMSQQIRMLVGLSLDGLTYQWYAGGTASGGVWSPVLQASYADAQTNSTVLAAGAWRVQLPALVEARFVEVGHFRSLGAYSLIKFYPRRALVADDVRAEFITARMLAAAAVTADAIATGALDAKVITLLAGGIIRSAASGQRFELDSSGLRTYDSAGNVQIEATTATDGALRAGGGTVLLNRDGIGIAGGGNPTTLGAENELRLFAPSTTTRRAGLGYGENTTEGQVTLEARTNSTRDAYAVVQAVSPSTSKLAFATLTARDASSTNSASVDAAATAGSVSIGLNINGVPRVRATTSGVELAGTTVASLIELTELSTPSAPGADKGRLFVRDNGSGKSQLCVIFSSGAVQVIATQP